MKVTTVAVYLGPNIYCQQRAVHFKLTPNEDAGDVGMDADSLAGLYDLLPGLHDHALSCGAAAPAESSNVYMPYPLSHLFEHICLELQRRVGADLDCVRERRTGGAADEAIVPCEEVEICIESARLANDLIASMPPVETPAARTPVEFDFRRRFDEFTHYAQRKMLPIQDRALVRAARARDVPVMRLAGRVIQLGHGRSQQRMSATKTTLTNVVSNDIAANKDYARRILSDLGLPVPRYARVSRGRNAVAAAKRIGFPVVVKPNKGNMGHAVSVGMKDTREVRAAYERARAYGRSVLVEEQVEGFDYRMLVINGELIAASKRVPGHVRGDGVHTIAELLAKTNSDPRRGSGQKFSWTRIEFDEQAQRLLADLGYSRDSVPAEGEIVYLRRNANTSDGGTAVDVTDEVHPDNREIAVRAAKAIGLDIAGVDLLAKDISQSLWDTGGTICEINSRPGLRKHMWPAEGTPRDVMTPIVDMLFPPGQTGRVPIIAVTGTGNTTTFARMLAHIFATSGHAPGLVAGHCSYVGSRKTPAARLAMPQAMRRVLLDPDVDMIVVELTVNDLRQYGLACDSVDVCVVINATGEGVSRALSQRPTVIEALQLVIRNTRSTVIVRDDGELSGELTVDSGTAELVHVTGVGEHSAVPRVPSSDIVPERSFASSVAERLGASTDDIERGLASFGGADGDRSSAIQPAPPLGAEVEQAESGRVTIRPQPVSAFPPDAEPGRSSSLP